MTDRHLLDLRVGAPWTDGDLEVFAAAARVAWASPLHPSSEGRRAATWWEAAEATARTLSGRAHVAFLPNRDSALDLAIAQYPARAPVAAATHRRSVLARCTTVLPVDHDGIAQWPGDALPLVQGANEETGVVDPLPTTGPYILDASNTFGRSEQVPAAPTVIADATAWGAPGGVAMVLSDAPLPAHTPPPLPLVAVAVQSLATGWSARVRRAQDTAKAMARFEALVRATIPDVQFHGNDRAPHIRSFSILHLDAETLTRALDARGYVVGSGSACVADGTPSHVLAAMGVVTHGNVRLALPIDADPAALEPFAAVLADTVHRLRVEAGVADL